MKVLITGGFGFLGLHVCKRLLAVGELNGADEERKEIKRIVLFDQGSEATRGFGLGPQVCPRVCRRTRACWW